MKKLRNILILAILSLTLLVPSLISPVQAKDIESRKSYSSEEIIELGYVPNEIIVKFKEAKINNNLITR